MNAGHTPQSLSDRIDKVSQASWERSRALQSMFSLLGQRVARLEQGGAGQAPPDLAIVQAELKELSQSVEQLRQQVEQITMDTAISRGLGGWGERLVLVFADIVADRLKKG